jgi:hypothetical protein
MAIEYGLVLSGDSPIGWLAGRAFPDPDERPVGTPPLLTADLYDRYGFDVTILAGRNGYVEIETEAGVREWEPDPYSELTFRMEKNVDSVRSVINMITVVRRVLDTGPEDAALTLNGDTLLLTRFGGTLTKHGSEGWWTSYADADHVLPG